MILHSSVVIGADGFGYTPDENGKIEKILQGSSPPASKLGRLSLLERSTARRSNAKNDVKERWLYRPLTVQGLR